MFFNKNRTSVTYVGMQITKAGNAAPYLEDNYKHEPIDVKVTPEVLKFLANVAKMPQVDARYDNYSNSYSDKRVLLPILIIVR